MSDVTQELLDLNQRLLDSIAAGDWKTYQELCDPTLSAIEPESHGSLVEGMDFHRFYFDLGGVRGQHQTTMAGPHVRLVGDIAIVCYVRLVQCEGNTGQATTLASAETRIWQLKDGAWKHIHFHRSSLSKDEG